MSRGGTWLVVAVVAAIALAAALDALLGRPEAAAPDPPPPAEGTTATTTGAEAPASAVPDEGPPGVLYYTDDGCELAAVRPVSLEPVAAPRWTECRFSPSPDGAEIRAEGTVWAADGRSWATEGRGSVTVSRDGGGPLSFAGSAPAFRPDGTLTFWRGGALRALRGDCPAPAEGAFLDAAAAASCSDVVLGRGALRAALGGRGADDRPFRVRDAAWLGERRLAVVLALGGSFDAEILALFDGDRVLQAIPSGEQPHGRLVSSPGGGFVAAAGERLLVLGQSGQALRGLDVDDVRQVAFSPDDRWLAAAAGEQVVILRAESGARVVRRLPVAALDLAWVGGTEQGSLLEDAAEARAWLEDAGAAGRLFVTRTGCRLSALRLPAVLWEEEPAERPAPCRFTLAPDDAALVEAATVHGRFSTLCQAGGLDVFDGSGLAATLPDACGPAWKPDGTLTFIRDGELWEGWREPRRLISRGTLRAMLGREAALEEVAWLDGGRLWAAVRVGENAVLAALTTSRLVFSPAFEARTIEGLEVSSTGMVAARSDRGVVLFDDGGRRALTFPDGRAVAWAPGALVAAVAVREEILFVAPISREVVALPLAVEDIEWVR